MWARIGPDWLLANCSSTRTRCGLDPREPTRWCGIRLGRRERTLERHGARRHGDKGRDTPRSGQRFKRGYRERCARAAGLGANWPVPIRQLHDHSLADGEPERLEVVGERDCEGDGGGVNSLASGVEAILRGLRRALKTRPAGCASDNQARNHNRESPNESPTPVRREGERRTPRPAAPRLLGVPHQPLLHAKETTSMPERDADVLRQLESSVQVDPSQSQVSEYTRGFACVNPIICTPPCRTTPHIRCDHPMV